MSSPPRPAPQDPWLGQTLSGCVLERRLGQGANGAAYLGRRAADGLQVAVKLLLPGGVSTPAVVRRLAREADALRRVKGHPNLVAVLAAAVEGAATPHLVLELAPGRALGGLVHAQGRLPAADAARVARDVARGLATLHGHGILHRDVKPENIVVAPDGRARLIDFGLAKDTFVTSMTAPGQLVGTAEYMAPEQWTGDSRDARQDLFSLGATLYFALTGRAPFVATSLEEIMELAGAGEIRPARELAPDLPPHLEQVLLHLLEVDPRHRYARAERAAQDLERAMRGEPPEGPPALVVEDGPGAPPRVVPLLPARRCLLGSGPRAQVKLPGAALEHAEVRRDEAGFTLYDLRSPAGTFIGDDDAKLERVTKPRPLADGEVVRVGASRVRLRDASGRRAPQAWLEDLVRREHPPEVALALAHLGDPRALAATLERLEPDPLVERAVEAALRALDPQRAPALLARRAHLLADERARLPAQLAAASGEALGQDPVSWLSWWLHARARFAEQVGPARPPRALRLAPEGGEPATLLALEGEPGVVLLGRDARCHARVEHPSVSRLHASALRLHRRLLLRDEGGPSGTFLTREPLAPGAPPPSSLARVEVAFLDPGATVFLGQARVAVEGSDLPPADGDATPVVDRAALQALEEAAHPAAACAHVAALAAAASLSWIEPLAASLHPDAPARQADLARALRAWHLGRAARARGALARLLQRDVGPDPAAWRAALAAAGPLPPQVREG